jgi:spore photoproduct lyase
MEKKGLTVKYRKYLSLKGTEELLVERVGDGSIIRRFDKTPSPKKPQDVVCPHFLELKWAYGCPYRCAWCYLRGTLRLLVTKTKPIIKDYDKIRYHVETFFDKTMNSGYIPELLNSGEISDSLMWEDNKAPFSKFISSIFDTQTKHKVLFLSKSDRIDNIVQLESDNIVPSFTLNADSVASRWERGAPIIKKRIRAARSLSEVGYSVRIRIDPIIPIDNWKKAYISLIDHIFSQLRPERITLGSLRGLQSTINNASDKSWVKYLSESSNWGKRVNSETRYLIYSAVLAHLKEYYNYSNVAFCKETKDMWNKLSMNHLEMKCNCIL